MVHTETGPNLTSGRQAVERLMDDVCVITRDIAGRRDASFHPETGRLTDRPPELIYYGRCKVREVNTVANTRPIQEGGATVRATSWSGSIPIDAADVLEGDLFTVTDSRRDGKLIGREYRVTDVKGGTFSVSRGLSLEFRQYVSQTLEGAIVIPISGPPEVVIEGPPGPPGPAGDPGALVRVTSMQVTAPTGAQVTVGNGQAVFRVPSILDGFNLIAVAAHVVNPSSSGLVAVQLARNGVDMLSTPLTIDSGEKDSLSAATPAVIGTAGVSTGDEVRVDIDSAGTGTVGLIVEMQFQRP